jgi:hypothetical protein
LECNVVPMGYFDSNFVLINRLWGMSQFFCAIRIGNWEGTNFGLCLIYYFSSYLLGGRYNGKGGGASNLTTDIAYT